MVGLIQLNTYRAQTLSNIKISTHLLSKVMVKIHEKYFTDFKIASGNVGI